MSIGPATSVASGVPAPKPTYPVQLVQPDGRRVLNREYGPFIADIGPAQLRDLYTDLVVVRRIDREAMALQRQGEVALWAPLLGQEAAQVGSARALHRDDYAFISYRETAVAYCRGVAASAVVPMWRGAALSGWDPDEFNVTNPSIVVGSHGLHATGYAFAAHLEGAEIATIAYFGDGASSQGDIAEAMNFASTWSAPVVFFCQNNHWAISAPVRVQSATPIVRRAYGHGMPGVQVDGNDVLAVLAVTRQAVKRAREGGGPSFIEALTYRMGPHTTSDDPTRYRTAAELEYWQARDPIDRMRRLLEREGLLDNEFAAEVQRRADNAARELRADTHAMADPDVAGLFEHVYATDHPGIERQRREYLAYLDSFEEAS